MRLQAKRVPEIKLMMTQERKAVVIQKPTKPIIPEKRQIKSRRSEKKRAARAAAAKPNPEIVSTRRIERNSGDLMRAANRQERRNQ